MNGVNGMIILPDVWTLPAGLSFTPGNSAWTNVYTTAQWEQMEANGAVFLPAAGYREGTIVSNVGQNGYYWSKTSIGGSMAHCLSITSSSLNPRNSSDGYYERGYSVRLVQVKVNQ